MIYTDETKKRCIALRRKFGSEHDKLDFMEIHHLWVKFVNDSSLLPFEKRACIKEFLNPKDLKRYKKELK